MIVIKCKSEIAFAAVSENFIYAEWRPQEAYYKAQGCTTENQDQSKLQICECEPCQSLAHNFEDLIILKSFEVIDFSEIGVNFGDRDCSCI